MSSVCERLPGTRLFGPVVAVALLLGGLSAPPERVSGERVALNARQSARAGKQIVGAWEAVGARKYSRGHYLLQDLQADGDARENWLFLDGGVFRQVDADGVQRKGRWLIQERLIVRTATDPHQSVAVVLDVPVTTSKGQIERVRAQVSKLLEGLPGGHVVGVMDASGDNLDWSGLEHGRSRVLRNLALWNPRPGGDRANDGLAAAAQFLIKSGVDGPARIVLVSDGSDGGSRISTDGALDFCAGPTSGWTRPRRGSSPRPGRHASSAWPTTRAACTAPCGTSDRRPPPARANASPSSG